LKEFESGLEGEIMMDRTMGKGGGARGEKEEMGGDCGEGMEERGVLKLGNEGGRTRAKKGILPRRESKRKDIFCST
jgi:hypothetical protein